MKFDIFRNIASDSQDKDLVMLLKIIIKIHALPKVIQIINIQLISLMSRKKCPFGPIPVS